MVRAYDNLAASTDHHAEGRGIDIHVLNNIGKPFKGDIGRDYRHQPAGIVRHRNGVRGHEHLAAAFVVIRLRPVSPAKLNGLYKPLLVLIVIGLCLQGVCAYEFPVAQVAVGRKLALSEGDGRSKNNVIVRNQTPSNCHKAVRTVNIAGNAPDGVVHSGFYLNSHRGYLKFCRFQLTLCPAVCLFHYGFAGEVHLQQGCGLESDYTHQDYHNALDCRQAVYAFKLDHSVK